MSEKIFTIPINEAFDGHDGCPMCRLRSALEENTLSCTLGAAMMEPDVRIKMNAAGFCREHLSALRSMKNKLALALILESHLADVSALFDAPISEKKGIFASRQPGPDAGDQLGELSRSFQAGSVVHAFLIHGDEGCGKKTLAQTMSMALHCTGEGECSWYDFAAKIAEYSGFAGKVKPCSTEWYNSTYHVPTKRPAFSSLENMALRCTVGNEMRNWQTALKEYISKSED